MGQLYDRRPRRLARRNSLRRGLIGAWEMDEGSGIYIRSRIDSKKGTLTNGAKWRAGVTERQAVYCDGVNDHVALGALADWILPRYSFALWVVGDVASSATARGVLSFSSVDSGGFFWGHPSAGFARAAFHNDGVSYKTAQLTSSLGANTLYYICGTYDGTNLKAYLNGALEATTAAGNPVTSSGAMILGAWGAAIQAWPGKVECFRLWNRGLSAYEVALMAKDRDAPFRSPLRIRRSSEQAAVTRAYAWSE